MPITETTRELLHNRKFRLIYGGYLASAFTDGLIPIVFTIEVLRVSESPWSLSAVLISLLFGRFLVVPLSGRLAATRSALHVMIGADLIRIAAQAGLVIFIIIASNSTAAMVVSALLYGVGVGIYMPAQQTVLPALVRSSELEKANAAFSATTDISFIAGPALGIAVTHLAGFSGALVLDTITFMINIAALLQLVAVCRADGIDLTVTAENADNADAPAPEGTLRATWRLTRSDPFLGSSLMFWTFASILIGMVAVYAPSRIIGSTGSAGTWAVIATVMAVSSLIGSVSAAIGIRLPYRFGVLAVAVLLIGQLVSVAVGLDSGITSYLVYAVFGLGALMTTRTGIQWTSAVQRSLSRADLGRFFAVESGLTAIAVPAGMVLAPLLNFDSGRWILAGLALGVLSAAIVLSRTSGKDLDVDYATT